MARGDGSRLSPRLSPSMSPLPSSAAGSERPGSGVYLASETDDGDSVTDASSVYSDDMVGAWWPQLRRLYVAARRSVGRGVGGGRPRLGTVGRVYSVRDGAGVWSTFGRRCLEGGCTQRRARVGSDAAVTASAGGGTARV